MERRVFLKYSAVAASVGLLAPRFLAFGAETAEPKARWYKGDFHAHSQWSDGKDLPEVVVDAYKKAGYDFFSLTDHNVIQREPLRFDGFAMNFTPQDAKPFEGETSFWKRVAPDEGWPNLTEAHLRAARDLFGADSVQSIETPEGKYVRMKTFAELKKQFADDSFLLFPGFELTTQHVHFNFLNVDREFYYDGPEIPRLVSELVDKGFEQYGAQKEPWLFSVNHPLWQNYNIQPSALIARPEIHFVELVNNTPNGAYLDGAWTPETFWDVVNAYRAANDQALLFGAGTDDSHGVFRKDYLAFFGWSCVRAKSLDVASIFGAMNRGDFYSSTGLDFDDVTFDGKTLSVRIKPKNDAKYRIEFVGTKKDCDLTPKYLERPAEHGAPARNVEVYSDEIGRKLDVFDGLEGSYTLKTDDLYVRARAYRLDSGLVTTGPEYLGRSNGKRRRLDAAVPPGRRSLTFLAKSPSPFTRTAGRSSDSSISARRRV